MKSKKCEEYHFKYYDDKNLFDLSYQHGCYKAYFKRKGANKSIDKMKKVLEEKIKSTEHEVINIYTKVVKKYD